MGYQMAFDSGKSKLTKNNFALGYSTGDFVLHTNVNDGQVKWRHSWEKFTYFVHYSGDPKTEHSNLDPFGFWTTVQPFKFRTSCPMV
jgi:hypothetical protein